MDKVYLLENRDFNAYDSWWLTWGVYATEALARKAALAIWEPEEEVTEFFIKEWVVTTAQPPVPKTQEEIAAFAKAWDAKVDASRAKAGE